MRRGRGGGGGFPTTLIIHITGNAYTGTTSSRSIATFCRDQLSCCPPYIGARFTVKMLYALMLGLLWKYCMGLCLVYCGNIVWVYAWLLWKYCMGLCLVYSGNVACTGLLHVEILYQLLWAYARFTVEMLYQPIWALLWKYYINLC